MSKYREVPVEISEEQSQILPEKITCPICFSDTSSPDYVCPICLSQVVFVIIN